MENLLNNKNEEFNDTYFKVYRMVHQRLSKTGRPYIVVSNSETETYMYYAFLQTVSRLNSTKCKYQILHVSTGNVGLIRLESQKRLKSLTELKIAQI